MDDAHLIFRMIFLPTNNLSRLTLLELIDKYAFTGRAIHDANIVAVMNAHGVNELLTYNKKDFASLDKVKLGPL